MDSNHSKVSSFGFIIACRKSDVMRKERTEHNRLRMSLAGILIGLYIFPIIYNIEKAMKTLLIMRHANQAGKYKIYQIMIDHSTNAERMMHHLWENCLKMKT